MFATLEITIGWAKLVFVPDHRCSLSYRAQPQHLPFIVESVIYMENVCSMCVSVFATIAKYSTSFDFRDIFRQQKRPMNKTIQTHVRHDALALLPIQSECRALRALTVTPADIVCLCVCVSVTVIIRMRCNVISCELVSVAQFYPFGQLSEHLNGRVI